MDSTAPASEGESAAADVLAREFVTDLDVLTGVVSGILSVPE